MLVVPALPATKKGVRPAARSAAIASASAGTRIRQASSVGISRTLSGGNPASIAAFWSAWCVWSEAYRVPVKKFSGSRSLRAAASAENVASEPPLVRMPPAPRGSPARSANQRTTFASICASPGAAAKTPT